MLYREMTNLKGNQKGMALGIVLMVALVLSLLGSLGAYRATQDVGQSRDFRIKNQSFYIAEAGLYRAVAELNDDINWSAGFTDVPYKNGRFSVTRTDPDVNRIQLTSVGVTNTVPAPQAVTLRAIGLKVGGPPPMFKYALWSAIDITLGGNSSIGGNVYSGGDVTISTQDAVKDGNILAFRNIYFSTGTSRISNGHALANDNVSLTDQDRVRVNVGNVYAGDTVTGLAPFNTQVVGGTVNQNFSPDPVPSVSYYETTSKYTDAQFADFMTQADAQGNLHLGNYSPPPGNYTGLHYVTGDLRIGGSYSGDAIWVVGGNLYVDGSVTVADGMNYAFIVKGTVDTTGLGNGIMDGFIYANGAVKAAGNSTVNGGVVSFGGITGKGGFTVNYKVPPQVLTLPGSSPKFKIVSLEQTS